MSLRDLPVEELLGLAARERELPALGAIHEADLLGQRPVVGGEAVDCGAHVHSS